MPKLWLLLVAVSLQAANVGSKACAACHAAIYQSFQKTPMAASSGPAGAGPEKFDQASFVDKRGVYNYRVSQERGTYFLDFRASAVEVRRRLEYFVGSGAAARSYLISVDGFLYEAPVAYYAASASWKLAPGYEQYTYPYLTRAIAPGCLECHASGVQALPNTQNAYDTPPFQEGGVSCERCHGPGDNHAKIVNPAKLEPARRDSVCSQCHLGGDVRVTRQKTSFTPGDLLSNHVSVFLKSGDAARMKVTSHVENLEQSACKRSSGDLLWCGSCHDPHSVPPPDQKVAWFRTKCLNCHTQNSCSAPPASRRAANDNCIGCHMPKNQVVDAEHVVYTDHSIRRRPAAPTLAAASAPLVPFRGMSGADRDLGLAYAILALRENSVFYRERALNLLKGAKDADALLYLAEIYKNKSQAALAIPLYERALRADPSLSGAAVALGGYAMERGDLKGAVYYWTDALAKSPALVLVRANLAVALTRLGRREEARATLQKALEFNPSFEAARDLLNQIPK